jgi:hypothetical protein
MASELWIAAAMRQPDIEIETIAHRIPKRYDALAGIELAHAPRRLLLAWESGSLVA